jgi:hypothetical protein
MRCPPQLAGGDAANSHMQIAAELKHVAVADGVSLGYCEVGPTPTKYDAAAGLAGATYYDPLL